MTAGTSPEFALSDNYNTLRGEAVPAPPQGKGEGFVGGGVCHCAILTIGCVPEPCLAIGD